MTTKNLWPAAILALFVAACSTEQTGPAPTSSAAARQLTTTAVRVRGDVIPARLTAIALPKPTEHDTIVLSDPASPKELVNIERIADLSVRTDFRRVITSNDPKSLSLPIDAPSGARVLVSVKDKSRQLNSVHLRDKSGKLLDRARDVKIPGLALNHVELPGIAKKGVNTGVLPPAAAPKVDVLTTPVGGTVGTVDSTIATITVPNRVLSVDVPTTPGRVTLDIPADIAMSGVIVEVQQPFSHIAIAGAAKELHYSFGEVAEVEFNLADDGKPIDGATFTGSVEMPNGTSVNGITFSPLGAGRYVARLPMASADLTHIGVWNIRATAVGFSNGTEFERDLEASFDYAPAHARMSAVGTPELVRGADGLIDEIKLDVDVETVVEDRFGLRAVLVFTGDDGKEHMVAEAQTGQTLPAGTGTMTLHFKGPDIAVTKATGPFRVRELALVSYAFATTQHRLGRGMDLVTMAVAAKDLRMPTVLKPNVQELIDLGAL